ncbi:MAG TPA: tetratricopeptide repeat protein [Streptosporangiaceae bacterium]|jgi:tetratricopeptide (TPR) repeat protein/transcriptional regulator with XRE-family HTH domain
MSDDGGEFGARLRASRQLAMLSQEELAQRCGLTARAIGNLERGQVRWPYPQTVRRLADALQLDDAARAEFTEAAGRRLAADTGGAGGGAADGERVVPRQLPAPAREFTGRQDDLTALSGLMRQVDEDTGAPSAVVITVISGTAGVGKTELALRWAHQAAGDFPDGQLYVNLCGYDPDQPLSAAEALAGFLHALGMPGPAIPARVAERAAVYRSLLAGRRMLIVLDNARDTGQLRPLLPGTPACPVIVTSRDALAGLVARDGARRLDVDLLPLDDAARLLRALIGLRSRAEPEALTRLATLCGRLPLALRVAAELAAARPVVSLTTLAGELADARHRLNLLDAGGDERTAVRAVLSWSYRHLNPHSARLFCLLGLHPGQDFDDAAAAALAGVTPQEAAEQARQLARAHLIQPGGAPGRYSMHDLLRGYARELCVAEHGEEQRPALTRLFDHYLNTAVAATRTLFPARFIGQGGTPGAAAPPDTDPAAARAWLDSETGNLSAVIAHMTEHGWPGHATRFAAAIYPYLEVFGWTTEAITICDRCRQAAQSMDDRGAEAAALGNLGYVYLQQGRYQQAARRLQQALPLFRQAGDRGGEALAVGNLAVVERRQGHHQQAADDQRQALALHRQVGDPWGEALALTRLAAVECGQGRLPEAIDHLRRAVSLSGEIGDQIGQAIALTRLGVIECRQGRHKQAERHHRRALALCRQEDDASAESKALTGLAEVMFATGHLAEARVCHTDALRLARQTGDRDQQAHSCHGLAHACLALGQGADGRSHLRAALSLYTALGAPEAEYVRADLNAEETEIGALTQSGRTAQRRPSMSTATMC